MDAELFVVKETLVQLPMSETGRGAWNESEFQAWYFNALEGRGCVSEQRRIFQKDILF